MPHIVAIARALGFRDARLQQSIVICKHAGFGCRGPPHHHSTFLCSAPPSVVGFWNALEDGRAGNGGLSFSRANTTCTCPYSAALCGIVAAAASISMATTTTATASEKTSGSGAAKSRNGEAGGGYTNK